MAHHLALAEHFCEDELFRRYRDCTDPTERTHWQVIWLKSQGRSTPAIASVVGYSENWIRTLIHRYNDEGAAGLTDRRHRNAGAAPLLSNEEMRELDGLLDGGTAPDGGLWTGPKVARWIEAKTGRDHVHDQRGWDYLVRLGFSAQTPRPRHQGGSPEAQAAFKK
jgi:transposase